MHKNITIEDKKKELLSRRILGSLIDDFGEMLMNTISDNLILERYLHVNEIDKNNFKVDLTFNANDFLRNHLKLYLENTNIKLEIRDITIK